MSDTPRFQLKRSDWIRLREEWIQANLRGERTSLLEFSEQYEIPYGTIRNHAHQEGWRKELNRRLSSKEPTVEPHLAESHAIALERLQEEVVTNEVQVRKRHAAIARGVQEKALRRLDTIDSNELTPRQAMDLLALGLREERIALGLKESAPLELKEAAEAGAIFGAAQADKLLGSLVRIINIENTIEGETVDNGRNSDSAH